MVIVNMKYHVYVGMPGVRPPMSVGPPPPGPGLPPAIVPAPPLREPAPPMVINVVRNFFVSFSSESFSASQHLCCMFLLKHLAIFLEIG